MIHIHNNVLSVQPTPAADDNSLLQTLLLRIRQLEQNEALLKNKYKQMENEIKSIETDFFPRYDNYVVQTAQLKKENEQLKSIIRQKESFSFSDN